MHIAYCVLRNLGPWSPIPRTSYLVPDTSPLVPRPAPLAPRPSSLVPRPSSLVPHPSPLAPRPSALEVAAAEGDEGEQEADQGIAPRIEDDIWVGHREGGERRNEVADGQGGGLHQEGRPPPERLDGQHDRAGR